MWPRYESLHRAIMIAADPRPMSSAPLDGTPVRLFISTGSAIASFWSEERSQKAFGAGDYRPGWYLLEDDSFELDDPAGWEPLTHESDCAYFEDDTPRAPILNTSEVPPQTEWSPSIRPPIVGDRSLRSGAGRGRRRRRGLGGKIASVMSAISRRVRRG